MKNPFNNQRGAIDLILILVFFVLAASLGGYVYYQQRQTQQAELNAGKGVTVTKHVVAKKTPAPAVDPYAGWSTLTSSTAGFTLRYPSTWKFNSTNNLYEDDVLTNSTSGATLELISFSKTSQYGIETLKANDTTRTILSATKRALPSVSGFSRVVTQTGVQATTIYELDVIDGANSIYVQSPAKAGIYTWARGDIDAKVADVTKGTPAQFLNLTGVQEEAKILDSLKY